MSKGFFIAENDAAVKVAYNEVLSKSSLAQNINKDCSLKRKIDRPIILHVGVPFGIVMTPR